MMKSGKGGHKHENLREVHQSDRGNRNSRLDRVRNKETLRDMLYAEEDDLDLDDSITDGSEGPES